MFKYLTILSLRYYVTVFQISSHLLLRFSSKRESYMPGFDLVFCSDFTTFFYFIRNGFCYPSVGAIVFQIESPCFGQSLV